MARFGAPALAPLDGVFLVSLGVRSMSRVSDGTSRESTFPYLLAGRQGTRGLVRWDETHHHLSVPRQGEAVRGQLRGASPPGVGWAEMDTAAGFLADQA